MAMWIENRGREKWGGRDEDGWGPFSLGIQPPTIDLPHGRNPQKEKVIKQSGGWIEMSVGVRKINGLLRGPTEDAG